MGLTIWSKIPIHLKKLQFRKTFSNHLKQLYLDDLLTVKRTKELDLNKSDSENNKNNGQLQIIVEENNETIVVIENSFSLEDIFEENDDDFHFTGF